MSNIHGDADKSWITVETVEFNFYIKIESNFIIISRHSCTSFIQRTLLFNNVVLIPALFGWVALPQSTYLWIYRSHGLAMPPRAMTTLNVHSENSELFEAAAAGSAWHEILVANYIPNAWKDS